MTTPENGVRDDFSLASPAVDYASRRVVSDPILFQYLLRLGDSPLILAQRLGEWVGHGPILEEDIAQTNVGLDLLGQARLWLSYAGEVEARFAPDCTTLRATALRGNSRSGAALRAHDDPHTPRGGACSRSGAALRAHGRSEDELAFLRDSGEFRNLLLVEQPNGNFADTTARQFLFDAWHLLVLRALAGSSDARIAEIAAKAAKEAAYHVERSGDWVIRLGDGTDESHAKAQAAIDDLWMYTGEMFTADAVELALMEAGVAADVRVLEAPWREQVEEVLHAATLTMPGAGFMQQGGKRGVHTEHLSHLLAEMQILARSHPGAHW